MAVPYGRKSRSRTRMRRAANMQYTANVGSKCNHCGEPKLSHHICSACGYYGNRQVLTIKEKS